MPHGKVIMHLDNFQILMNAVKDFMTVASYAITPRGVSSAFVKRGSDFLVTIKHVKVSG